MLLLSALWLAVVHVLASFGPPASLGETGDRPSRVASVHVAGTEPASAPDRARPDTAPASGLRTPRPDDEALRPPAPPRLPAVDRASNRSVIPLRSPVGLAAATSADLALLLASVPLRAAHPVSHAAAAHGGHLPYFPTAPPLHD